MIPKIFKFGDFVSASDQSTHMLAQSIFEEWLKNNSKVVYSFTTKYSQDLQHWSYQDGDMRHSHQALVVCIEEIAKKCVKHEPAVYITNAGTIDWNSCEPKDLKSPKLKCKICGIRLRPVYEEDNT